MSCPISYLSIPTNEARRAKWQRGRDIYGTDEFQGDPFVELDHELLDAMNYVEELKRRGVHMAGFYDTLLALRSDLLEAHRRHRTTG